MTARRIAANAETYRMHSAGCGDLRGLSIDAFAVRWAHFVDAYNREQKFRIDLARLGRGI